MPTREEIVAEAREWFGTPWIHQASLKGVGTDCIGYIGGVALNTNVQGAIEWRDDPDFKGYGMLPDPKKITRGCEKYLDPVMMDRIQLADILVFTFIKEPMHFAIISTV